MGCATSKIDDLPAIILCRERLDFLSQALHQRYAFAEAHVAYAHSLSALGVSLRRFFDSSTAIPSPAVVNLPPQRKLQDADDHDDDDDSGSHLHFHSDDDDDDDDDDVHALHHDDGDDDDDDGGELHRVREASPPRMMMYDTGGGGGGGGLENNGYGFNPYMYSNGIGYNGGVGGGGPNMHMNYMKKHVTPSVSYEQRPVTYETERVQFGDPNAASSSSSSSNYYDYFGVSGTSAGGPNYNYYNGNNNGSANNNANNGYMNDYGAGFYGAPPANPRGWPGGGGGGPPPPHQQQAKAAPPPPPPPPPPPATSAWDFMNLFESIDNHYQSYAGSRDSREVREEEGIPDLEDEEGYHEHEVVKEVHGNQKLVDDNGHISGSSGSSSSISSGEGRNEGKKEEVVVGVGEGESSLYRARPSASSETAPVEYEVHMVDKKVVGDPGKAENQAKGGGGRPVFRNVSEVVHEIQVQFERAAASGNELTKVLEVGKFRYHRKTGAYQVSAKMLNVITPSLPSSSRGEGALEVDEDLQLRSVNLSATLQKLYLWEKKLFEEVKAEEKMRVLHDRKSDKLRHLADKGAEPQKIETTRNVVRGLSTKIRIAIQIVDRISVKISKLRDEELWPQLNELIQGLSRMWKAMLECHHNQCEAIDGARGLDAIAFPNNPSESHLEASLQLEQDLRNWTNRFTEWIGAQKGYVGALNRWLLKCISYEPEETADGIAPFSPGRAGAPPVFVICNQWDQSLERISETSEKELINAMRVFSSMIRERDIGELRQRMPANKDMEKKVKILEKEDMKMQKKMVLASGDTDGGLSLSGNVVYQSDTSRNTSLQAGLRQVFEAMDRFTADSVKAYEELLQRTEEVIRQQGRVS